MTYPTYPTYPNYHPNYSPSPVYPVYPANNQYNPWRSYEQAAANAEPAPQPKPARGPWATRYGFVFAVVAVCVTAVALVLANVGPSVAERVAGPTSGLTQVFDGPLTNDGKWDNTDSCYFSSSGLDVSSRSEYAQCQYRPTANADLTSQGFWLQVTVAPAASVSGQEVAVISAGGANVELTQQGSFMVCQSSGLPCTLGARSSSGETVAWHTDSYVSNTIAVRYTPGDSLLTVYVNGQQITSLPAGDINGFIALGTAPGGEALYTHAALYSASGS